MYVHIKHCFARLVFVDLFNKRFYYINPSMFSVDQIFRVAFVNLPIHWSMASLAHLKLSCHSRFIFRCRFSFPRINLKCAARFSSSNMSMFSPSRLSVFRRVSDIWMKGHSISTQHQHLLSDIQSILDVVEVQRDFPALRSKLIDFHEQLCRENVWENLVTAQVSSC